jgi:hypothetical protein
MTAEGIQGIKPTLHHEAALPDRTAASGLCQVGEMP